MEPFWLQFMDMLFGKVFITLSSRAEIKDKALVKVIHKSCGPQDAEMFLLSAYQ